MHKSSILRMEWFVENYALKLKKQRIRVLDVGSYNYNGSYKDLFASENFEYFGLDMEKGPNVDIVLANPYDWNEILTDSFDIVISGQAFEHIEFFWLTMAEMTRVLKKDGLMCIIAPNGFCEHRFPVDCYRFFTDGMIALARYVNLDILHSHTNSAPKLSDNEWFSKTMADSILVAQKKYSGETQYFDRQKYICIPANHELYRSGLEPYNQTKGFIQKILNKLLRIFKYEIIGIDPL